MRMRRPCPAIGATIENDEIPELRVVVEELERGSGMECDASHHSAVALDALQ